MTMLIRWCKSIESTVRKIFVGKNYVTLTMIGGEAGPNAVWNHEVRESEKLGGRGVAGRDRTS